MRNRTQISIAVLFIYLMIAVNVLVLLTVRVDSNKVRAANENNSTVDIKSDKPEFSSNEILIKVQKRSKGRIRQGDSTNTGIESLNKVNKDIKARKFEKLAMEDDKPNKDLEIFSWYKVTIDSGEDTIKADLSDLSKLIADPNLVEIRDKYKNSRLEALAAAMKELKSDPNVMQVEPNIIVRTDQTPTPTLAPSPSPSVLPSPSPLATPPNLPNDPFYLSSGSWGQNYADLWGLKKIDAEGAWRESTGSQTITVAVVDTGIDRNHPDIKGNVASGWNFLTNTTDAMDDNGHGTHVAGIIGAAGNNALGVVGVNWRVNIMPFKFFNS